MITLLLTIYFQNLSTQVYQWLCQWFFNDSLAEKYYL